MKKTQMDKRRYLLIVPIVGLILAMGILWAVRSNVPSNASLYTAAVADAVIADAQEIMPLVELSREDAMTSWDEQGRVLLLSWHAHPDRYPEGQEVQLSEGSIWTFTDREIARWYEENKNDVSDWDLRLEQLIGLPPEAGYTHVSGFWVDPVDVIRPAYITDIVAQMQTAFPADADPSFVKWFEENSQFSYKDSAYPWTRLGYTYDWADNGVEYGLTEFLVEENASVETAFTKTTKEFVAWLGQQ